MGLGNINKRVRLAHGGSKRAWRKPVEQKTRKHPTQKQRAIENLLGL